MMKCSLSDDKMCCRSHGITSEFPLEDGVCPVGYIADVERRFRTEMQESILSIRACVEGLPKRVYLLELAVFKEEDET